MPNKTKYLHAQHQSDILKWNCLKWQYSAQKVSWVWNPAQQAFWAWHKHCPKVASLTKIQTHQENFIRISQQTIKEEKNMVQKSFPYSSRKLLEVINLKKTKLKKKKKGFRLNKFSKLTICPTVTFSRIWKTRELSPICDRFEQTTVVTDLYVLRFLIFISLSLTGYMFSAKIRSSFQIKINQ